MYTKDIDLTNGQWATVTVSNATREADSYTAEINIEVYSEDGIVAIYDDSVELDSIMGQYLIDDSQLTLSADDMQLIQTELDDMLIVEFEEV